jgi:uncharacterized protein
VGDGKPRAPNGWLPAEPFRIGNNVAVAFECPGLLAGHCRLTPLHHIPDAARRFRADDPGLAPLVRSAGVAVRRTLSSNRKVLPPGPESRARLHVYTEVYTPGLEFEWDDQKEKSNLRKHGLAFEDAITLFDGPYLERLDDRHDYGEERYVAYGCVRDEVVVLVYTWRGPARRIISARKATKVERETYYAAIQPS